MMGMGERTKIKWTTNMMLSLKSDRHEELQLQYHVALDLCLCKLCPLYFCHWLTRSVCSVLIGEAQSASYFVNCACVHLCACLCIAAFCNPVMLLPIQFLVSCFFLCRAANTITANPGMFCSMLTCPAQRVSNLASRAPVCELQRFERATEQECCRPSCSDSCPESM